MGDGEDEAGRGARPGHRSVAKGPTAKNGAGWARVAVEQKESCRAPRRGRLATEAGGSRPSRRRRATKVNQHAIRTTTAWNEVWQHEVGRRGRWLSSRCEAVAALMSHGDGEALNNGRWRRRPWLKRPLARWNPVGHSCCGSARGSPRQGGTRRVAEPRGAALVSAATQIEGAPGEINHGSRLVCNEPAGDEAAR